MSTTAPKPPTKRLFASAVTAGTLAAATAAILSMGYIVEGSIPPGRMTAYWLAEVALLVTAVTLGGRYFAQRWRRAAWRDGHAARIATDAANMPLARIQAELEDLTEAVYDLADAAGRPRSPRAYPTGSTYASRAVQGDTVLITRNAQPSSSADAPVQLAERTPTDPIAEARAEGYAEGYVDGIARRDEGASPN
ncbi:hypothetical protein [Micromonospora chokoriensis]|uniref:hypothetical protein n=1 Tax=Micromonospora chokoriensis TaxID=356851 RepID=UPI0004C30AB5|nr:hypothetical protein [Micromonospora chokoriensis]